MSDFTIAELLLFQLFLIFLNALFACAEIAVISINDNKLKRMAEGGNKKAARLYSLTQQPAKFLATIQVGITLAGFLGSAFAADNFSDKIVDWLISLGVTLSPKKLDVLSVIGITLVLSYATLILGELVPKRIAMRYAEKIGLGMSALIYVIAKLFAPLVWFLTFSTNTVLRLIGMNPEEKDDKVTEEEIRIMIDVGTEEGTIDHDEKILINNVFEFDEKTAEDVMTHRTKVVFLDINDTPAHWEKIMIKTRFSVYPVYQDDPDNVIGTLRLKDYFKYKSDPKELIKKAVKPIQFVPTTMYIDNLFKTMQKSRNHFAAVVDEYGSLEGIVTMNDLLEEIVGELEDDAAQLPSTPLIKKTKAQSWRIKGEADIEEVEKALDVSFDGDSFDTFGGFILSQLGYIPSEKDNVSLSYKNLSIKVTKVKKRKIEEAVVSVRA